MEHLQRPENKKGLTVSRQAFVLYGAGTMSRTRDLLITSQKVRGFM
jgi:hypothetical protein